MAKAVRLLKLRLADPVVGVVRRAVLARVGAGPEGVPADAGVRRERLDQPVRALRRHRGSGCLNVGIAPWAAYRSTLSGRMPSAANRIARSVSGFAVLLAGAAAAAGTHASVANERDDAQQDDESKAGRSGHGGTSATRIESRDGGPGTSSSHARDHQTGTVTLSRRQRQRIARLQLVALAHRKIAG